MPMSRLAKFNLPLIAATIMACAPAHSEGRGDWSGAYLGIAVGATWQNFDNRFTFFGTDAPGAVGVTDDHQQSILGSIYGGYSLQMGHLVLGIEGDIAVGGRGGDEKVIFVDPPDPDDSFSVRSRIGTQASLRGRVGVAWDHLLIFAAIGVSVADVTTTVTALSTDGSFPTTSFTQSKTVSGLTLGGGLDYALSEHWIARAEYRHTDYGAFSFTFTSAALTPFYAPDTNRTSTTVDDVRVGLSYRF